MFHFTLVSMTIAANTCTSQNYMHLLCRYVSQILKIEIQIEEIEGQYSFLYITLLTLIVTQYCFVYMLYAYCTVHCHCIVEAESSGASWVIAVLTLIA